MSPSALSTGRLAMSCYEQMLLGAHRAGVQVPLVGLLW